MSQRPHTPDDAALTTGGLAEPGPALPSLLPSGARHIALRRRRHLKDLSSKWFVAAGGIAVILSLGLIFLFLFLEVVPMLLPARMEAAATYPAPGGAEAGTLHLAVERYLESGARYTSDGRLVFFSPADGSVQREEVLPLPEEVAIIAVGSGEPRTRITALGLSDGTALVVEDGYQVTYPDDVRLVTPEVGYPLGEEPQVIDPEGRPLVAVAVQRNPQGGYLVAGVTDDQRLLLVGFEATVSFLTGEVELRRSVGEVPAPPPGLRHPMVSMDLRDLVVADAAGRLLYYDIRDLQAPTLLEERQVVGPGVEISAAAYLLGTVSIIVGGSDGSVTQWALVRDDEDNVRRFAPIRGFTPHQAAVTTIHPESSRKGFATGDAAGGVAVHFATSSRTLLQRQVSGRALDLVRVAPRADGLIAVDDAGLVTAFDLANEHPQVSLTALWGRVWYEGRSDPEFIWQSSSATDEFEPKLSLMPLTVGTIKAAFYAMLVSIPLALMGALYTGYFMSPRMRGLVKPTIEIMEALPTVILGFLAGLWFAPFVESHLPAVFSVVLLMPLGMVVVAFLWHQMKSRLTRTRKPSDTDSGSSRTPHPLSSHSTPHPRPLAPGHPSADRRMGRARGAPTPTSAAHERRRLPWWNAIPDGWEAALLIPVVLGVGWLCVWLSPLLEIWFFDGSMRQWFTDQGIPYDQRNALVVGVAMGFAVIPTIFSIAEDAIFNVPKHLSQGSLALGATPWQTMVRVILLTASPGLFSAVMIGLGRAVGETMIVLMATGNSPVMSFNIFEGMRTLSANIAVEMPETEVGGTHYRVLFLAALVLFAMTFVVNTAAEIVRQRLRRKYASL